MKQLLFFVTALILAVLPTKAQSTQVATLSHEGTITTFYSGNALKDAYAAAAEGDVITLSSGTFNAVNIEKNITLRGAGMFPDSNPTVIAGNITVRCPQSETNYLTLEGFYHNGTLTFSSNSGTYTKDARIVKCQFKEFTFYQVQNLMAIDTFFSKFYAQGTNSGNFFNCYIGNAGCYTINSATFTNCVLWMNNNDIGHFNNSTFKNCIIGETGSGHYFPSSTFATYCYYYGGSKEPFQNSPTSTNVVKNDMGATDIFSDTDLQILKEELQSTWLGDDGTQVGIYGGFLPFDPTPTNPQITKFNVASKTTADGKLSVDIEVKAN